MKEKIVLIGAGQHAKVVLYNARVQNKYDVATILDPNSSIWGNYIDGVYAEKDYKDFDIEYLRFIEEKYGTKRFFIGIGAMSLRKKIFEFFVSQGWESVNIVHPNAVVSKDAKLGSGILIEAGCLITPSPFIGNNVVVNTGSQVNHDNVIEDHVYIASGVVLSGGVTIGENTLLDDGVIVSLGRKIGKNVIIGAGAIVTKDVPDNVIAYGCPCRVIKENKK